jgi:sigma-B regulation protein RsbU (phosphoserine phosphatase)
VPDEIFAPAIEDKTEPFHAGRHLVLYTDGVTEAPNEEEKEFSSARLADAVRALHTLPPARSTTGSSRASARFSGGAAQRDDLTLVTVKRD